MLPAVTIRTQAASNSWGSRQSAQRVQSRSLPRLRLRLGLCSSRRRSRCPSAALNSSLLRSGQTTPRSRALCAACHLGKENTMTAKPTLLAYAVKNRGKGKTAIWTRIGAAWPHGNGGNGFSVELEAFPVDGRLVLIEPKADGEVAPTEDEQ